MRLTAMGKAVNSCSMRCVLPVVYMLAAGAPTPAAETPLFMAAQLGDADAVGRLLSVGVAVNEVSTSGLTALHAAALADNPNMVALLAAAGADLTQRSTRHFADGGGRAIPAGVTPLQAASLRGRKRAMAALHIALDRAVCQAVRGYQVALLKPLLEAGGNAQQKRCGDGDGPLTEAAQAGHADLVALLADHGADVNAGGSALRRAFEGGSTNVLKLLLKRGADVKLAWQGRDFLPYTWRDKDIANFKLLVEAGLSPNVPGADTMTPFHHVARNAELVRFVLSKGGNPNAVNAAGFSVLHAACMGPDATPVRLLLEAGAKVDARQDDGLTPLARACASGSLQVVQLLLQKGADPKTRSKDGTGLVIWATLAGNPDIIRAVVAAGAPVDGADNDGSTALHWVSSEATAQVLLALGADVKHPDRSGQTPLHRAAERDNSEAVMRLLLARGADINAADSDGQTPLHTAHPGNVAYLIAQHADINRRDKQGRTPLLAQLEQGDTGAMALLQAGADAHVEDAHGLTALHWAALGNAARSAQELLKRGLNVNAVTKSVFHYKTDDVDKTFPAASTPVSLCAVRDEEGLPATQEEEREEEDVARTLSEAGGKR